MAAIIWLPLDIYSISQTYIDAKIGAKTKATIDINLIKILIDGPDVSLNGSPTVSPVTAALWASEPL